MEKTDTPETRPQREADRRKRQAAALKANLKRRKTPSNPEEPGESEETSA